MKKLFVFSALCVLTTLFCHQTEERLRDLYIDFNESMHMGFTDKAYASGLKRKPQRRYVPYLGHLYEKNNFLTKVDQPPIHAIPKVIHQIWLGSPLPERYRQFQETWIANHPDWEYRLWTDEDIEPFHLVNQEAFDKSANYAEQANILRYEILYRYGGLYVDTDFECLQPFDLVHSYYEFYTGMTTIDRLTLINNGLIASIPGHPIMKALVENVNKKNYGHKQFGRNGTIYFGYEVIGTCIEDKSIDLSRVMILPATYCYPWPGIKSGRSVDECLLPTTLAIHYWDSTWRGQTLNDK